MGFYHMETKVAYNVLMKRIAQNERNLSTGQSCCSCFPRSAIEGIMRRHEYYQNMRQIVSLRLSSSGPKEKLNLPDSVLQKAKRDDKLRSNRSSDYYYSNAYLMSGGGGCGGGWYAVDTNIGGGGAR